MDEGRCHSVRVDDGGCQIGRQTVTEWMKEGVRMDEGGCQSG